MEKYKASEVADELEAIADYDDLPPGFDERQLYRRAAAVIRAGEAERTDLAYRLQRAKALAAAESETNDAFFGAIEDLRAQVATAREEAIVDVVHVLAKRREQARVDGWTMVENALAHAEVEVKRLGCPPVLTAEGRARVEAVIADMERVDERLKEVRQRFGLDAPAEERQGGGEEKTDQPTCPGPDCMMCNGEACALCGAGCHNNDPDRPPCEHDVIQRHTEPHASPPPPVPGEDDDAIIVWPSDASTTGERQPIVPREVVEAIRSLHRAREARQRRYAWIESEEQALDRFDRVVGEWLRSTDGKEKG